jgi:hypothetical protein
MLASQGASGNSEGYAWNNSTAKEGTAHLYHKPTNETHKWK